MEFDYYRSPCQGTVWDSAGPLHAGGTPPPTGAGAPRRRASGRLALILFLSLILLTAAALAGLRILAIYDSGFSWNQFADFGFYFEIPDDSYEEYYAQLEQDSTTATTIPRTDPVSGVQLLLVDLPDETLSFQAIYEKVIPSIVSVQAYGSSGAYEGTGVIMTEDGYIITNYHIISGCSSAAIVLSDGTRYEAKLAGSDAESDLAVLKVDAVGLTPAEFGNSDQIQVGDTALAIGNPLGSDLFGTLTEGIISAINRDVNVGGYDMSLIQTTAALNPGNSGGALVNTAGQVIGITNMKMMSTYETIEGLGFAIPTTWVKEVVDTLLAQGAITGRPTLGITCSAVSLSDEPALGQSSGVYVNSVTAQGPAAQAGVLPGDIILAANGQSVYDLDDLTLLRDEAGVGGEMRLTIWRDGETLELTLTLVDQYELN